MRQRINPFIDNTSNKKGFIGFIESKLKKVRNITFFIFFLLIVFVGICCMGLSIGIATTLYDLINPVFSSLPNLARHVATGILFAGCFFSYGVSLIIIVPMVNFLLGLKYLVKPFRGNAYSLESIPWYLHNALIYLVRYSFIEFITPSPLNVLFFKLMGMKVGKGVIINTSNISDACLIELEDYVTIGGSAHLLSHYSQSGYLIVSKLKIGRKTTVGLKATIFGDVVIGENCLIKPHSVVLPKSRVENNTKI